MIQTKENNKGSVTNPKEMEIYNLPTKELKIIILKKPNQMKINKNKPWVDNLTKSEKQ